jgi:hypothetical protein
MCGVDLAVVGEAPVLTQWRCEPDGGGGDAASRRTRSRSRRVA